MDDNPFVDPTDVSPFDDPAIQAATRSSGHPTAVIEVDDSNDNPFHDSSHGAVSGNIGRDAAASAADDLRARQQELDRKEAELRRRENALNGGAAERPKNWPPLPTWSPIKPCMHMDIEVEIPQEFQPTVKRMYQIWLGYVLVLLSNALVWMIIMFAYSDDSGTETTTTSTTTTTTTTTPVVDLSTSTANNTTTNSAPPESTAVRARRSADDPPCIGDTNTFYQFLMAIVWFCLFAPASIIWYRAIYKAFRDDSSFHFFVFFFVYFFQLIFHIIQAIGADEMGYGGWLQVFKFMGCNVFCGILLIITSLGFTGCAILNVMQMMKIHDIYRSSGKTLRDAQNEWATGVISNPTVQSHAKEFASNVIQEQVNQQFSTGTRQ